MNRIKKWLSFLLLTNKSFRLFRWLGIHVTRVHFYSPIPDIREFGDDFWEGHSDLIGIEMNADDQRLLMETTFVKFQDECDFPKQPIEPEYAFYSENPYFGYVSAAAMHSMVRQYRPQKIVEVGAGYSTRVLAHAATLNAEEGSSVQLTAIDPYPNKILENGFPGLDQLLVKKIQDVDINVFTDLRENDILSIDTSHAAKTGGDVVYLYLEILPRLASGVIVHIHDIFLPYDYPQLWLERRIYWNEQYLLQAFLSHNEAFRVLWGQKYAEDCFPDLYKKVFSNRLSYEENFNSYCFWFQKSC